jgi:hypothetical protein
MKILILCHGVLGFGSAGFLNFIPVTYFKGIAESISEEKIRVLEPSVSAIGTIATRAKNLIQFINDKTQADDELYFIAHSMGGLDVMQALPELSKIRNVKAVTTIGTPYGGSEVADVIYNKTNNSITRAIPLLFRPLLEKLTETALKELTTLESKTRNLFANIPNSIKVTIIAGDILENNNASRMFNLASAMGGIHKIPNDGLVTIASALPDIPEDKPNITLIREPWRVDHIGQIGWFVDRQEHIVRYCAIIENMTGLERKNFLI